MFQGFQMLPNLEIFNLYKSLDLLLLRHLFLLLTLIFVRPFVLPDKDAAISEDTGLIHQPVLFSTRQKGVSPTLVPVQRSQSQPPSDLTKVLARLGP